MRVGAPGQGSQGDAGLEPILPRVSTPAFLGLPPGASTVSVSTARGSFATFVAGDPALPTALLVAGFTGSKEDFIAVLEPLADAGYHVVAYDQRGQYETPGPAGPEGWTSTASRADLRAPWPRR